MAARFKIFLVILGCLGTGYLFYLDQRVTDRFEGRRFSVPAQVYSEAFLITKKGEMEKPLILKVLQALRYEPGGHGPGGYSLSGNHLIIRTRAFGFPEGERSARVIRITFQGDQVERLEEVVDFESQLIEFFKLEPIELGQLFPHEALEDRRPYALEDMPKLLQEGVIAVEDRRFYDHHGISFRSIGRAFLANVQARRIVQGGSTLTQQLVKNLFLTKERSYSRKLNEALMALILEFHYSKALILETYLNQVFLGQDGERSLHGFGKASEYFFGKRVGFLAPDQLALLVGLLKGPSYFDPLRQPKRALSRRNQVLKIWHEAGLLLDQPYKKAVQQPLGVGPYRHRQKESGDYLALIQKELSQTYPKSVLRKDGLKIFTYYHPFVQKKLEKSLNRFRKAYPELSGVLVAVDLNQASLVGLLSRSEEERSAGGYHRALLAKRPIGSLVKPLFYLQALEEGYHLGSPLEDSSIEMTSGNQSWEPANFDGLEHGVVPLAEALAHSYNQASVWLAREIGFDKIEQKMREFDLLRDEPFTKAMVLGSLSKSPLEMAQFYQTLATGTEQPLRSIRAVLSKEQKLMEHRPLAAKSMIHPAPRFLLETALQKVMTEGTGRGFGGLQGISGKTGTSQDGRDTWFVAWDQNHLLLSWAGRDDYQPTPYTGASLALPLVKNTKILTASPVRAIPEEVIPIMVNEAGQKVPAHCDGAREVLVWEQFPVAEGSCSLGRQVKGLWRKIFGG